MANTQYQGYSLTQLARDIGKQLDSAQKTPPMTSQYWHRLKTLFSIINGDQPDLNAHLGVPRYNGGLFNPALHPFLEQYFVGDRYLVAAIDVLARRETGDKKSERRRENVDYRTLGVRQLGSIYEGLLEYQPRRATEAMIALKKGKKEEWLPLSQKPSRVKTVDSRDVGAVYLVTDKGERKATGSYYTPDYIVKYIVEQTLQPLVDEARANVKANPKGLADPSRLFVDEILQLNVLDPAMGSGHFLVEATDYLARAIATDAYVVRDEDEDDDLTYWRRQVVEACIYGVDKNPMAVELAKLSLWLVTVARDKPLSFLDHHLQHGDSLVGARLDDLNRLPTTKAGKSNEEQPLLLDESALTQDTFKAVGGMMTIEKMLSDDIEDIHHKEVLLKELHAHLHKWQQIADLWTSTAFGNTMSVEEYADLLRHLQGQPAMMSEAQRDAFLNHPTLRDNDYFHWELAFPEVFFDEFGRSQTNNAGFDAIIGNPPWVNIGRESGNDNIVAFLKNTFTSAEYQIDLYSLFIEESIILSQHNAYIGIIVPDSWLANYRTPKLRKLVLVDNQPLKILHTSRSAFPNVGAEHLILVLKCGERTNKTFDKGLLDTGGKANINDRFPFDLINEQDDFVVFASSHVSSIIKKIESKSTRLGQEFETIRGVGPYHHRKQPKEIIDERAYHANYQKDKTFVPNLQGEHLKRYGIYWKGDSWISYGSWLAEPRESRFFEGKRLLLREIIGDRFLTTVLEEKFVVDRGIYIALQGKQTTDILYVLALFSSSLLIFWFREKFNEKDELFPKLRVAHFNMLPIKNINFTTAKSQRSAIFSVAETYYQQNNFPGLLTLTDEELATNRNDTIHDLLAYLAQQMIGLNQQKQATLEAFWLDFEGVITDPKIFDILRNKGKWEQSLHKAIPAVRPFLNPNSRSTITLDTSLGWNEKSFKGIIKELVGSVTNLSQLVKVYRQYAPPFPASTNNWPPQINS